MWLYKASQSLHNTDVIYNIINYFKRKEIKSIQAYIVNLQGPNDLCSFWHFSKTVKAFIWKEASPLAVPTVLTIILSIIRFGESKNKHVLSDL